MIINKWPSENESRGHHYAFIIFTISNGYEISIGYFMIEHLQQHSSDNIIVMKMIEGPIEIILEH